MTVAGTGYASGRFARRRSQEGPRQRRSRPPGVYYRRQPGPRQDPAPGAQIPGTEAVMAGMTIAEKILARAAGQERVRPGEIVVCEVDVAVQMDMGFLGERPSL